MSTTIKLSTPIKAGDKTITELEIREPNLRDLRLHGLPVNKDGQVDFNKAANLLESTTGVQKPYLDLLTTKDSLAAVKALSEYFADADEEDAKK